MVQHYVEDISRRDQLRLVSDSDVFTLTGRTKIAVVLDLQVRKIDDNMRMYEYGAQLGDAGTPGVPGQTRDPVRRVPHGESTDV